MAQERPDFLFGVKHLQEIGRMNGANFVLRGLFDGIGRENL